VMRVLSPVVHAASAAEPPLTIEFKHPRKDVLRALRLLAETVVIPSTLLAVLLHYVGLAPGLAAVIGWCTLVVAARFLLRHDLPGTLLLCTGMICGRACVALITSSAVVYLLQPVLGSILMAVIFLGSAVVGRPITVRLARDFVRLPAELFARRGVHRVFTQVALLWGLSRLLDAGMSLGFLHWGVEAGLLSRGMLSGLLTTITVLVCASHGWRKLCRLPGVTLRIGPGQPATA
jgi:hypothetical protein